MPRFSSEKVASETSPADLAPGVRRVSRGVLAVGMGSMMREYRWFFHSRAARPITTGRGRFLTDNEAIAWAVGLLQKQKDALSVEIWDQVRLVSRRQRGQTI